MARITKPTGGKGPTFPAAARRGAARVFDIKAKGAFHYIVAANVPLLADI